MEVNPYQSPQADDHADAMADPLPQRSWPRIAIGSSCVFISLLVSGISLTVPQEIPRSLQLWLFMGGIAGSFAVMGIGMFLRRDKLAFFGLAILALLITTPVVLRLMR